VGNAAEATRLVARALELSGHRTVSESAALPLALAGDVHRAKRLIEQCSLLFPTETEYREVYLPRDRAALGLARKDPAAVIDALRATEPYELGHFAAYWPAYLRGVAELQRGDGKAALAQFHTILSRTGLAPYSPLIPLAHLQTARAAALTGDLRRSLAEYDRFLELWKDADPDIPALRDAKEERRKRS
jgi:hypothetical protein